MGHVQGQTPIQFDNIFANGIITSTVVQRRSKATDMYFYGFMIDAKKNYNVHWKQGRQNLVNIYQNITTQNITFQSDLPMYSIPSKI